MKKVGLAVALMLCMLLIGASALAETIVESKHPYNNDVTFSNGFEIDGADALALTFSYDTYVESGYDFIEIYYWTSQGSAAPIGGKYRFTGTELQGKTILIPSNGASIDLRADKSINAYGFKATVRPLTGDEAMEAMFQINSAGTITKFFGFQRNSMKEVKIPETIGGVKVTGIGADVFKNCSAMEKLIIPDGVTSIGSGAFSGCAKLKSIEIPESVTSIGSCAFEGCSSLEGVVIPAKVRTIYADAFADTPGLKHILFRGWNEIDIRDGAISYSAMIYAYQYSYIDSWVQNSGRRIRYIDDLGPSDVISISIPSELQMVVGESAELPVSVFPDVEGLQIRFSSSAPEIAALINGRVAAKSAGAAIITASAGDVSCTCSVTVRKPATLELPDSLRSISAEAFTGTTAEKVIISDKTINIGDRAFANCKNLKLVVIPDSVTSISETAFDGCDNVTFLCASNNTAAEYAASHGIPYRIG